MSDEEKLTAKGLNDIIKAAYEKSDGAANILLPKVGSPLAKAIEQGVFDRMEEDPHGWMNDHLVPSESLQGKTRSIHLALKVLGDSVEKFIAVVRVDPKVELTAEFVAFDLHAITGEFEPTYFQIKVITPEETCD